MKDEMKDTMKDMARLVGISVVATMALWAVMAVIVANNVEEYKESSKANYEKMNEVAVERGRMTKAEALMDTAEEHKRLDEAYSYSLLELAK